jgi:hypothetical protein
VSKNGLFLVSLVAAVPGGLLVYLMVMAFLNHAGGPTMWPKALAGTALLIGLVLAVMPFGILVFGGPKAEKAAPEKKADEEADNELTGEQTIIVDSQEGSELSESDSSAGATDPDLEVVEAESEEFAMTGEIATSDVDDGDDFETGSDFEMGSDEDDAVEVIESEDDFEEDAPKKKK